MKSIGRLQVGEPARVSGSVQSTFVARGGAGDAGVSIRKVENSSGSDYRKLTSYVLQSLVAAKGGSGSGQLNQSGASRKIGDLSSLNWLASLTAASLVAHQKQREEEERRTKAEEREPEAGGKRRPGGVSTAELLSSPLEKKGVARVQRRLKVSIPLPLVDEPKPDQTCDRDKKDENLTIAALLKARPPEYTEDGSTSDTVTPSESQSYGDSFVSGWDSESDKPEQQESANTGVEDKEKQSDAHDQALSRDTEIDPTLEQVHSEKNESVSDVTKPDLQMVVGDNDSGGATDWEGGSGGLSDLDAIRAPSVHGHVSSDSIRSTPTEGDPRSKSQADGLGSSCSGGTSVVGGQSGAGQAQLPTHLPADGTSTAVSVSSSLSIPTTKGISNTVSNIGCNPVCTPSGPDHVFPGMVPVSSFHGGSTQGSDTIKEMELDPLVPHSTHALSPQCSVGPGVCVSTQSSLTLPSKLTTAEEDSALTDVASEDIRVCSLSNGLSHASLQQKDAPVAFGSTRLETSPISAHLGWSSEALLPGPQQPQAKLPPLHVKPTAEALECSRPLGQPEPGDHQNSPLSSLHSNHDSPSPSGKRAPLQDILCRDFTLEIRPCTPRKRTSSEHSPELFGEEEGNGAAVSTVKRLRLTGNEEEEERATGTVGGAALEESEQADMQVSVSGEEPVADAQGSQGRGLEEVDSEVSRLAATVPLDVNVADLIAIFQDPSAEGGQTTSSLLEAAAQMESTVAQQSVSQIFNETGMSAEGVPYMDPGPSTCGLAPPAEEGPSIQPVSTDSVCVPTPSQLQGGESPVEEGGSQEFAPEDSKSPTAPKLAQVHEEEVKNNDADNLQDQQPIDKDSSSATTVGVVSVPGNTALSGPMEVDGQTVESHESEKEELACPTESGIEAQSEHPKSPVAYPNTPELIDDSVAEAHKQEGGAEEEQQAPREEDKVGDDATAVKDLQGVCNRQKIEEEEETGAEVSIDLQQEEEGGEGEEGKNTEAEGGIDKKTEVEQQTEVMGPGVDSNASPASTSHDNREPTGEVTDVKASSADSNAEPKREPHVAVEADQPEANVVSCTLEQRPKPTALAADLAARQLPTDDQGKTLEEVMEKMDVGTLRRANLASLKQALDPHVEKSEPDGRKTNLEETSAREVVMSEEAQPLSSPLPLESQASFTEPVFLSSRLRDSETPQSSSTGTDLQSPGSESSTCALHPVMPGQPSAPKTRVQKHHSPLPQLPKHLKVSVPLRLVEVTHHTTIECYSPSSFTVGDIVWAKAVQLPGWPGRIISHKERKKEKLKPAPPGKVSVHTVTSTMKSRET